MKRVKKDHGIKKEKRQKVNMISSAGSTFFNWMAILFKMGFSVDFPFLFKSFAVTVISFIMIPFTLLEMIIFNNRIKKIKIKSPVFIIGHMRSGTTFLHYILSNDRRFAYLTTTDTIFPSVSLLLGRMMSAIMNFLLPSRRPMDNMEISNDLPQEDEFAVANLCPYSPNNGAYFPRHLVEYYEKYSLFKGIKANVLEKWKKTYDFVLKKAVFKSKKDQVLSKNLVNASRIKVLSEMYPDAKFINIYRNPYSVFLSTKKLYKKFIFSNMAFQKIDDDKLEENIITLAKIGFQKYFEDRKCVKKGNLIEVQYESFVKEPLKYLKKIYEELDIPDFERVQPDFEKFLKSYENYKPDNYEIEDELKNRIFSELKFIFDEFKYNG